MMFTAMFILLVGATERAEAQHFGIFDGRHQPVGDLQVLGNSGGVWDIYLHYYSSTCIGRAVRDTSQGGFLLAATCIPPTNTSTIYLNIKAAPNGNFRWKDLLDPLRFGTIEPF